MEYRMLTISKFAIKFFNRRVPHHRVLVGTMSAKVKQQEQNLNSLYISNIKE
jgi:hypothetical protein